MHCFFHHQHFQKHCSQVWGLKKTLDFLWWKHILPWTVSAASPGSSLPLRKSSVGWMAPGTGSSGCSDAETTSPGKMKPPRGKWTAGNLKKHTIGKETSIRKIIFQTSRTRFLSSMFFKFPGCIHLSFFPAATIPKSLKNLLQRCHWMTSNKSPPLMPNSQNFRVVYYVTMSRHAVTPWFTLAQTIINISK